MLMLIRIVRLTLHPNATQSFHGLFAEIAPKIRQLQGCHRLELWTDRTAANIVATYSEWESESSLNSYRKSDLFREAWAQVKPFFVAPAEARSYDCQKVT